LIPRIYRGHLAVTAGLGGALQALR
jgi:hypothetical protein